MGRIGILTKSNLKTSKGASICVGVLLLVASLLLNISLILMTDYKSNFYKLHDKLNAEHVCINTMTLDENYTSAVKEILDGEDNVSSYEISESFASVFHLPFNGGNYSTSGLFLKYDAAINKKIGKYEFVGDTLEGEGVYLPYLFKVNGNYLGQIVPVSFNEERTFNIKVLGFFNNMMVGSNNCSMTSFLLSDGLYDTYKKEVGEGSLGYFTSIRLKEYDDADRYEGLLAEKIKTKVNVNGMITNNINLISNSRYITQVISSTIILVLSVIVSIIAVVISAANIKEYIKDNMKKIGALKALGYTSFDIIFSFMLQFGIIALTVSLVGIALSYAFMPIMNNLLLAQTGIPYKVHFVFGSSIITVVVFVACILLTICFSCLSIRKIEAIDALRDGIKTHSFKKNLFNLDKKGLSLNISLGLKTMINNIRGNITAFITALVLSFILVFDMFLLFNSVVTFDPMVKLICAITPDGVVYVNNDQEESLIVDFENDDRISRYYYCSSSDVSIDGKSIWTQIAAAKDVEADLIIKGKAPIYKNEIAIGYKLAKNNNYQIGDTIEVSLNGIKKELLISGFTQNSNYLGNDALLTREGFDQFNYWCSTCYNIEIKDGYSVKDVLEEYQIKYNAEILDYKKETESFVEAYENLLAIVFFVILVISLLVVSFVLVLLVRGLLDKKKQEYGILKAVGFQTKDLIKQTMVSFIPMLLIGSIVGSLLGYFLVNTFMSLSLSGVGIYKCNLEIPWSMILVVPAILVCFSLLIVYLKSLKVRKIEPYKLLIKE